MQSLLLLLCFPGQQKLSGEFFWVRVARVEALKSPFEGHLMRVVHALSGTFKDDLAYVSGN
jgi:hypothetical protein